MAVATRLVAPSASGMSRRGTSMPLTERSAATSASEAGPAHVRRLLFSQQTCVTSDGIRGAPTVSGPGCIEPPDSRSISTYTGVTTR